MSRRQKIALAVVVAAVAVFALSYLWGPRLWALRAALVYGGLIALYVWLAYRVSVAAGRKGRSENSWFWIAFFFGIVLPAVIVAIMGPAPAPTPEFEADAGVDGDCNDDEKLGGADNLRPCPYCAEDIKKAAVKCRYCGSSVAAVH